MSLTSVPLQYSALTGPLGFSLEWYYFGRCMHFRHSPVHSHGALATKSIVASNLQVSSTNCTVFPHSAVMRMVHEHNHRHPELVTVGALNSLTNGSWKEPMKSCLDTFPPQLVRSCYWFPLQEYKGMRLRHLAQPSVWFTSFTFGFPLLCSIELTSRSVSRRQI